MSIRNIQINYSWWIYKHTQNIFGKPWGGGAYPQTPLDGALCTQYIITNGLAWPIKNCFLQACRSLRYPVVSQARTGLACESTATLAYTGRLSRYLARCLSPQSHLVTWLQLPWSAALLCNGSAALLCVSSLLFANDIKCSRLISSHHDSDLLQTDLDPLCNWMKFKCVVLHCTTSKAPLMDSKYMLNGVETCTYNLGSGSFSLQTHYDLITTRAYRTLGLIRRTFTTKTNINEKKVLYISLVRSQLLYCSVLWRPKLIRDIQLLERVRRRATKYILNDFHSSYKCRLLALYRLPLIRTPRYYVCCVPHRDFDLRNFVTFSSHGTRSSSQIKLTHKQARLNVSWYYFNRLPRLWNSLPPIDLELSLESIKGRVIAPTSISILTLTIVVHFIIIVHALAVIITLTHLFLMCPLQVLFSNVIILLFPFIILFILISRLLAVRQCRPLSSTYIQTLVRHVILYCKAGRYPVASWARTGLACESIATLAYTGRLSRYLARCLPPQSHLVMWLQLPGQLPCCATSH